MATTRHDNLIDGRWQPGEVYSSNVNPSVPSEVVGEYAQGGITHVDAAVAAARAAFPTWSTGNIQVRSDALDKIGTEILARREDLGTLLAREEGKTRGEAIGEVTRAGNIFKFYSGECLRLTGETIASVRPGITVDITREPVGVVGVIAPWNFPIAIPSWKVAPALAYGNCVILKPADLVPGSSWALAEIISRSGIPHGVFNLVMGRGSVVGDAFVHHNGIDAISFTGSVGVGNRIAVGCASSGKKVQLEMGGKNPQIVLDDANLEQAVELCVQSAYYSTGQRCTASSRLVVTAAIHDRFVAAMKDRMGKIRVGNALAPDSDVGPVSSRGQLDINQSYVEIGKDEGAHLAFAGAAKRSTDDGFYMGPVLFTETMGHMRINREEIFGPVASIIRVKDYDEALVVANDTPFGLAAGIATTSLKYASHFKRHSESGMVMVNLPTAGVDYHVPFGGRKNSSYGSREQGRYAQEFFTTVKTAYVNP